LLKTEPDAFSIDDLERLVVAPWDGVRSVMARNNLRAMKVGERAFFYHSSTEPKGVVGVCEIVREAYPDHTAWDPESKYFDDRSTPEKPRWFMPDVRFVMKFDEVVPLTVIRATPGLEDMDMFRYNRLSVSAVTEEQWAIICGLAGVPIDPRVPDVPPILEPQPDPEPEPAT
jgi:predicted RNA-binding protein with PUA-like domain